MNPVIRSSVGLLAALLATSNSVTAGDMPSQEEMWKIIQQQQRQIEALRREQRDTREKVEATGEVLDTLQTDVVTSETAESTTDGGKTEHAALGPKHDPFEHGKGGNTVIGGYGELHYNNLDSKKEIDFHRAILFLGHQFTDRIRFFSEIEYEHADTGRNGAVELEQAYLEFDLTRELSARAGLFLVPAGILNETHEPATFYGVERNPVERYIIPTTWWVGGAGLNGEIAPGWSFDLAVHEGLDTSASSNYAIRKGRQNTSEADANDLASTGRIKWTGLAGVELAASVQYQQDVTQGNDPGAGHAWLYEAHADVHRGAFGFRALYALWNLDGSGPKSVGADEQTGFYVEPSYRLTAKWGLFARYNQWDNQAGNSSDTRMRQYNTGVNFWPHPDVVLKADLQMQDNEGNKNDNGFNLGVGYQF